MRRPSLLQQRLGWRLLLSYLIVLAASVLVLGGAVGLRQLLLPSRMPETEAGEEPVAEAWPGLELVAGDTQLVILGVVAAVTAAVAVSAFTAARIVGPIEAMRGASQAIAQGDYRQRVPVPGQDELAALAGAFNRMAETLERTELRRLQLVGDVAHELRTPLSSIRSIMEGLVDGVLPAEPEAFQGVQREVARLERLVRDLEELSRVEAGEIPLELRALDLAGVVASVVERLAMQFADKGVALEVTLPDEIPPVKADPTRLVQVLTNLLGNALQYTPTAGRVTVHARREGRQVIAVVQDTGIGIAAEHLPHIFERFYRVDRSRSRAGGGSGIGLTLAKHLVEAHGGRIWAASAGLGQGSTFYFTLTIAE